MAVKTDRERDCLASVILLFVFVYISIVNLPMVIVRRLTLCWRVRQILLIQIKCFHEIITIGYVVYRSHELPWFRTLSWYFLVTSNYFFYGESMVQYFGVFMSRAVCRVTLIRLFAEQVKLRQYTGLLFVPQWARKALPVWGPVYGLRGCKNRPAPFPGRMS